MEADAQALLDALDRHLNAGETLEAANLARFPMPVRLEGAWMYLAAPADLAGLLDMQRSYMAAAGAGPQRSNVVSAEARSGGRIAARVIATARAPGGETAWHDESIYFLRREGSSLAIEMIEVLTLPDDVLTELTGPSARRSGAIHRLDDISRARPGTPANDTQETK